jgi:hypothetical protein
MTALLWKECRENLKWAALALLIVGGIRALIGPPSIMDDEFLQFVSLCVALFGAALGFLQFFFESDGDRRALLLHRPMSRSRIFLGKTSAGLGLYLLAMGVPFALALARAATPGHVARPFDWRMGLPWLADILTGVVWYFAGVLTAQRSAQWYGSRGLGLAAAFFGTFLVWTLPEFWHALLAIAILSTFMAAAAWGSFLTGGEFRPQPRVAKIALTTTFLVGLQVVSITLKLAIGAWLDADRKDRYTLDQSGGLLIVHTERGKSPRVTDLEGQEPVSLRGKLLDSHATKEIEAPMTGSVWPRFHTYRNPGRFVVPSQNSTTSPGERWFYVSDQGRLLGYDQQSRRSIGTFDRDGFAQPGQQTGQRFRDSPYYPTLMFNVGAPSYLSFPDGVFTVDFMERTLRTLYTPEKVQAVVSAIKWKDDKQHFSLVFVLTDKSVQILNETGSRVLAAPLVHDLENYGDVRVAKLENPERFAIWYSPSWHLPADDIKNRPSYIVEYDAAGREIARRKVPHRPLVEPSPVLPLFGLLTTLAEATILIGTTEELCSGSQSTRDEEVRLLPFVLGEIALYFTPGIGLDRTAEPGAASMFWVLIVLSAALSGLSCCLLARRYAFSLGQCFTWSLCGLIFGLLGLLLLAAVYDWPARTICPRCRRSRVVTRDLCEHCGAPHAPPLPDGTEIIESNVAAPQEAMVAS